MALQDYFDADPHGRPLPVGSAVLAGEKVELRQLTVQQTYRLFSFLYPHRKLFMCLLNHGDVPADGWTTADGERDYDKLAAMVANAASIVFIGQDQKPVMAAEEWGEKIFLALKASPLALLEQQVRDLISWYAKSHPWSGIFIDLFKVRGVSKAGEVRFQKYIGGDTISCDAGLEAIRQETGTIPQQVMAWGIRAYMANMEGQKELGQYRKRKAKEAARKTKAGGERRG